jgi:hypothetical protein
MRVNAEVSLQGKELCIIIILSSQVLHFLLHCKHHVRFSEMRGLHRRHPSPPLPKATKIHDIMMAAKQKEGRC